MRRAVVTIAVLALGAVARLAAQGPGKGDPAPVIAVHDLDGKPVELGQWIGHKPVLKLRPTASCMTMRE